MSETYSVVVTGKLLNNETLNEVKNKLGQAFKLKDAQLDKLFGGKPVALKRGLDKKQAVRLSARLQQLGAHTVIKASVLTAQPAKAKPAKEATTNPMASMVQTAGVAAAKADVKNAEPVKAVAKEPESKQQAELEPAEKPVAVQSTASDTVISCPRCGHEQPFTTSCGYCKMDLSMHIIRLERKAKADARRG